MNKLNVLTSKPRICIIDSSPGKIQTNRVSTRGDNYFSEPQKQSQSLRIQKLYTPKQPQVEIIDHDSISNDESFEEQPGTRDTSKNRPDYAQWYPNAVYCMLETYKRLKTIGDDDSESIMKSSRGIWKNVAEIMRKSYFNFTPMQCKWKTTLLRKGYLQIRSLEDAEKFEYFTILHSFYKDPRIERVLRGGSAKKINYDSKNKAKRCNMQETVSTEKVYEKQRISSCEMSDVEATPESDENYEVEEISFDEKDEKNQNDKETNDDYQMHSKLHGSQCTTESYIIEDKNGSEDEQNDEKELKQYMLKRKRRDPLNIIAPHRRLANLTKGQEQKFTIISNGIRRAMKRQEQQRELRHQQKLLLYREYHDKLLAQQEQAIQIQRELMEKLIKRL